MAHMWICHGTHVNTSWHTREYVMEAWGARFVHVCAMNHSYVLHDSCMCDMTHAYESRTWCVPWLIHMESCGRRVKESVFTDISKKKKWASHWFLHVCAYCNAHEMCTYEPVHISHMNQCAFMARMHMNESWHIFHFFQSVHWFISEMCAMTHSCAVRHGTHFTYESIWTFHVHTCHKRMNIACAYAP